MNELTIRFIQITQMHYESARGVARVSEHIDVSIPLVTSKLRKALFIVYLISKGFCLHVYSF